MKTLFCVRVAGAFGTARGVTVIGQQFLNAKLINVAEKIFAMETREDLWSVQKLLR